MYLAVHELVLRRRTLKPFLGEQHRVPRVVDVDEHLHGNHRVQVLRHVVQRREVADHVVSVHRRGRGAEPSQSAAVLLAETDSRQFDAPAMRAQR